MIEQSLLHVTLNMNHRRSGPRSEVSQEAIDLRSVLIQKSEFPIPGQAAYRCDVFEPGGRCPCFQVLDADGVSLVSFGVGLGVDCLRFPGDGVAGRFCQMPFVVGAGPGAESSGP